MATFTWIANTPTGADWNTAGDWTLNGVPSTVAPGSTTTNTDVATFSNTTSGGGTYVVKVAGGETFDVATIGLNDISGFAAPTLSISGNLLTTTLAYVATNGSDAITINAGGVFDIRSSITETGSRAETITIGALNAGGRGTGGHLELGTLTTDNANVTYSFNNFTGTPRANTGEIEFQSGFASGAITNQHISNLAWGDEIVFDGANFTGDTATLGPSNTLIVTNGSGATVLTMNNVTNQGGPSFQVLGNAIVAVCYAAGTHILTATGNRMVESLMQGDIVLTLAGGELVAQPVRWIGQRWIDLTTHPRPETVAPVRIRRGAFADNMPHSDLLLSPDHAVFVDGKLICARQLVNGTTIRQETDWASVEYFHVELDSHAILLAEGLPAESYLNTGNRGFFANSGEPLVLHPDLTDETHYPARAAGSCAPFVSDEASVLPVWQRLAERAAALGQPAPRLDTTGDPELQIIAKGRTLRPLYGENGLYVFVLPKGATEVRLISRAGAPTDARPWLDDRRCLGVNVERIVVRSANELREVPVDHPDLSRGWHVVERDGIALRRWTSGDAVLPLPVLGGARMLEIRAGSGGMTYLSGGAQGQRAA
jgi:hypothetical protein